MSNVVKFSKGDAFFDAIYFVLQARSTDDIKEVFTFLYVDDENIVCTDSKRLHLCSRKDDFLSDMEKGLYAVEKCTTKEITLIKVEQEFCFPNYKQVIPSCDAEVIEEINLNHKEEISFSKSLYKIYQKCFINYKFIKDISLIGTFKVSFYGEKSPIIFESTDFPFYAMAVIMPIVIKG